MLKLKLFKDIDQDLKDDLFQARMLLEAASQKMDAKVHSFVQRLRNDEKFQVGTKLEGP